ncbi:MAG: SpoIIE family protein phosphatase [Candidatus Eisenbacteria bacterium]|uniref:SpoIIE family protein phosphatase n=1 Tax=Eiseniibacteriota bacterium TaxID=2212470 RepID=A0A9D6L3S6_UNCEI|nr:SpoIIE family protein phosphatase [Candidatus Eisenbacteria bacterium]MBI3539262.1 SpoIIE family protein phosphatase [Candidatus Eisenbacteria bacterium]
MALFLSGMVGDRPRTWPLDGPVLAVGRSSRHPVHIPDGTVSKDHAEITFRAGQYYIRDLGSRNGTRVNGREARDPILLEAGDRVEIGHVVLRITGEEPRLRLKLEEQSITGTTLRLKAEHILEQRTRSGRDSTELVHLLAEAGRLLVLPRPLKETCDELLTFVAKAVPASRYVILLDPGDGGEPVQVAARTTAGRADRPLVLSRSIMGTVLRECTSVLTRDTAADPRFQAQHSIVAQSVHAAMAVPLFDNEKVLGLIYVDSHDPRSSFDEDRLELLTLLGNMAAVKITNARLLEAERERMRIAGELETATHIQRGLLPGAPPEVAGYQIDAYLETCHEVGGDLYDLYTRRDGTLVLLVGDVTGKGIGAALLMSSFLASARVLYDACTDPAELARRLGAMLHQTTDRKRFVTGFVATLDPATGALTYVNAGHPAGLAVAEGRLRELASNGVPFGVMPEFPYSVQSATLAPGETLAIYTDGIPEAQRGEELFGDERLHAEVIAACADGGDLAATRQRILATVDEFLGEDPRTDDITLLLLRRAPAAG